MQANLRTDRILARHNLLLPPLRLQHCWLRYRIACTGEIFLEGSEASCYLEHSLRHLGYLQKQRPEVPMVKGLSAPRQTQYLQASSFQKCLRMHRTRTARITALGFESEPRIRSRSRSLIRKAQIRRVDNTIENNFQLAYASRFLSSPDKRL